MYHVYITFLPESHKLYRMWSYSDLKDAEKALIEYKKILDMFDKGEVIILKDDKEYIRYTLKYGELIITQPDEVERIFEELPKNAPLN